MCVKGSDPELEREAARESGAICRSGVDPRACGHAAKDWRCSSFQCGGWSKDCQTRHHFLAFERY